MQLAYTIIYVPQVAAAMTFYQQAFGLMPGFLHDSQQYGEMNSGEHKLAFVSEAMAAANGVAFMPNQLATRPAGIEIAFVTQDVESAYQQAIKAGAHAAVPPQLKPWGQTIAYVRDLNGVLVELCSPMVGV